MVGFAASTWSLHLSLSNACCVALPGSPIGRDCSAMKTANGMGCFLMVSKASSRSLMSSPRPIITAVGLMPAKVPALLV